ncbi:MAG: O-antigen ligase family protein [Mycoplasmatales bacterium]
MIYCVLIILYYYKRNNSKEYHNNILNIITLLSIFAAIIGLIQYIDIISHYGYQLKIYNLPSLRVRSLFFNANYYANICELVVLICIYKLTTNEPERYSYSKYYYAFIIFINLVMILLSGSRTSWGALAVSIPVLFLLNKNYKRFLYVLGLELLSIYFFVIQLGIFPRMETLARYFNTRVDIWIGGIKGFMLHPLFGMGPYSYRLTYKEVGGPPAPHAHNLLIDALLNYGIVLITLIIIYFVYIALRSKDYKSNIYWALTFGIVVSVFVRGMFDVTLTSPQVAMLFFFIILIPKGNKIE